ncbi:hypothetical protein LAJPDJIK_00734 [Aeromonas salmonicida]
MLAIWQSGQWCHPIIHAGVLVRFECPGACNNGSSFFLGKQRVDGIGTCLTDDPCREQAIRVERFEEGDRINRPLIGQPDIVHIQGTIGILAENISPHTGNDAI